MNVCRNIYSSKVFIYIKEVDWKHIEVVTPINQIKVLERRLFGEIIDGPESNFLRSGVISADQIKAYNDYKRFRTDDKPGFAPQRPARVNKPEKIKAKQIKGSYTMKTIEIDKEVYEYLESKAKPFEETTPNQVIRRLLGLNIKPAGKGPTTKPPTPTPTRKSSPPTNLSQLVNAGLLENGQSVELKYLDEHLSKQYVAKIDDSRLLYEGKTYSMSALVKKVLIDEGIGIPSGSYRGPKYWFTSHGVSIMELWDQYLGK